MSDYEALKEDLIDLLKNQTFEMQFKRKTLVEF